MQLRDHHDPVLGHGHDPSDDDSDDDDGHRVLRSCLGHSLSPCCPLALSVASTVRLATLGLTVHMYTLYTLYNISHRTVLLASNFKRLNTFVRRQTRIRNKGIPKINASV